MSKSLEENKFLGMDVVQIHLYYEDSRSSYRAQKKRKGTVGGEKMAAFIQPGIS